MHNSSRSSRSLQRCATRELSTVSYSHHVLTLVRMQLRPVLAILVVLAVPVLSVRSQSAAPSPIGTWRGTSLCLVRPSACNDETVVYYIKPLKTADSLTIDARKIVRGEEEEMGVLNCQSAAGSKVTCAMRQGVWHFTVKADSLVGELR